jgi:arsenite methyltransferase
MMPRPEIVKSCCAAFYEGDFARALLGDSFHPGGLDLTRRLGELLELGPGLRVLDVASGKGESAIFLAKHFGCRVEGIDFSSANVAESAQRAQAEGAASLTSFRQSDAESLPFSAAFFDRVICECSFCVFPNKQAAAAEFARVLIPGGKVGLSDLTRSGPLPADLEGLLAWIACIGDALPPAEYIAHLESAGFINPRVQPHDDALFAMVRDIQSRLLALQLMSGLNKMDLAGVDLAQAKQFARSAANAIGDGMLGYALITAETPC